MVWGAGRGTCRSASRRRATRVAGENFILLWDGVAAQADRWRLGSWEPSERASWRCRLAARQGSRDPEKLFRYGIAIRARGDLAAAEGLAEKARLLETIAEDVSVSIRRLPSSAGALTPWRTRRRIACSCRESAAPRAR